MIDVNTPRSLRTCDRREEKKTFNIISSSNKIDVNDFLTDGSNRKRSKTTTPVADKRKRGPYKKTKLQQEQSTSLIVTKDDENKSSTSSNGIKQKSLDTYINRELTPSLKDGILFLI